MRYNQSLDIPVSELINLDIPSRITEAQLEDSGYTYKFEQHKELVKRQMAENLLKDIEFKFRVTPEGVTLIGAVNL